MTSLALLLVLLAAFTHATWNYLTKRAGGGTAFVWLFGAISTTAYLPLAAWILVSQYTKIGFEQLIFMVGTAILHCVYFFLLDKGYRVGDLSLIYPLARGTGPLLASVAAVLVLGEQPSTVAMMGILLIGAGVFFLTGDVRQFKDPKTLKPVLFAILCGIVIATYTIWDKVAVSTFLVPPLLLDWSSNLGRTILLAPYAIKNRDLICTQWQTNKKLAIGVGILCPFAYILVLSALVFSPVSYIAPAREVSVLIGTLFGVKLLAEGNVTTRLLAAGTMVIGLIALGLG